MKKWLQFILVVSVLAVASPELPAGENSGGVVVIIGSQPFLAQEHAANEFVKYASKLVGYKIEFMKDDNPALQKYEKIILIGSPKTNLLIQRFVKNVLLSFSELESENDGFIIKSFSKDGKNYLVLGGNNDRGILYSAGV